MDEREGEIAVRKIAREGDPDRYASALFAPGRCRDYLFTLYAFNIELARIGEQVREPGLGEIRLQWWREAVERAASGEPTGHPVADALGRTVRECALSRVDLAGLIDARSFDVSVRIMPDSASLETYLNKTAGALFLLASEITDGAPSTRDLAALEPVALEPVARVVGLAYGLTGLMRALPVHAARGRVDLPSDALRRHGISLDRLLAGETSKGLIELLAALRGKAKNALDQAVRQVAALAPPAQTAFLPLALVDPYLAALAKHDPLRQIAEINPLYRLWRLGTYRFRGAA